MAACAAIGLRSCASGSVNEGHFMHKSYRTLFAAAGLALFCAPPAQAQSALGPYLFSRLGYDQMPARNLVIHGRAVSSPWKPGWGALAGVGDNWYYGLRTEAEYSARVSWIKAFNQT